MTNAPSSGERLSDMTTTAGALVSLSIGLACPLAGKPRIGPMAVAIE